MDVSCPRCDTVYELDDRQVESGAATLQCSQCGHLFRLDADSGVQNEVNRRWVIRQADGGEFLYFTGFDTLHEWIMAGKVGADDEISRTEKSWRRLGDIGEFAPVFQVVESIAHISESSDRHPKVSKTPEGSLKGDSVPLDSDGDAKPDRADDSTPKKRPGRGTQPGRPGGTQNQPTPSRPKQPTPAPSRSKQSTPAPSRPKQPTPAPSRSKQSTPAPSRPKQPTPAPSRPKQPTPAPSRPEQSTPEPSRPEVQLDEGRFESGDSPSGGDGASSGDKSAEWTLGELEGLEESEASTLQSKKRRRWPLVVVLLIVVAGLGVWQHEEVERFATDLVDQVQQPDDDPGVEPTEDPFDAALAQLNDDLDEAVTGAQRELDRMYTGEAVGLGADAIVEAVGDASAGAEAAAETDPAPADPIAAGRQALDRGDANAALPHFQAAVEESPDDAEAVLGLAQSLLGVGQHHEALGHFERVRQLDSSLGDALIGIGSAARSLGRNDVALEAYEQYLEEFPDGPQRSIAEFQSEQLRD